MSGHVPVDAYGECQGVTAGEQTAVILTNLEETLSAVGGSRDDFVSTSVFLTLITDIDEVDTAYRQFFTQGRYPTRTTVQIAALGRPEYRVEISAVAHLPRGLDDP